MNSKGMYIGGGILLLLIVGMFSYSYLAREAVAPTIDSDMDEEQVVDMPYPDVTRIDARHFYADGEHTVVGVLTMPTPCDVLDATAVVAESFPEQIMIDIGVVQTDELCAQVLTEQRFLVTASASEEATFSARFMGRPVELNLIPAAPGETPDAIDFSDKG